MFWAETKTCVIIKYRIRVDHTEYQVFKKEYNRGKRRSIN